MCLFSLNNTYMNFFKTSIWHVVCTRPSTKYFIRFIYNLEIASVTYSLERQRDLKVLLIIITKY